MSGVKPQRCRFTIQHDTTRTSCFTKAPKYYTTKAPEYYTSTYAARATTPDPRSIILPRATPPRYPSTTPPRILPQLTTPSLPSTTPSRYRKTQLRMLRHLTTPRVSRTTPPERRGTKRLGMQHCSPSLPHRGFQASHCSQLLHQGSRLLLNLNGRILPRKLLCPELHIQN
jgi:hypothetical protein